VESNKNPLHLVIDVLSSRWISPFTAFRAMGRGLVPRHDALRQQQRGLATAQAQRLRGAPLPSTLSSATA